MSTGQTFQQIKKIATIAVLFIASSLGCAKKDSSTKITKPKTAMELLENGEWKTTSVTLTTASGATITRTDGFGYLPIDHVTFTPYAGSIDKTQGTFVAIKGNGIFNVDAGVFIEFTYNGSTQLIYYAIENGLVTDTQMNIYQQGINNTVSLPYPNPDGSISLYSEIKQTMSH